MKLEERSIDQSYYNELLKTHHPFLAKILAGREKINLNSSLKEMLSPKNLKNIDHMADILANAIKNKKKLLIVSDYDADGATGCSIGLIGLKRLGANISFVVPDRAIHGYGLTPSIVQEVYDLKPDYILTVDNGITSIDGVEEAKKFGMPVLVTDHHLQGYTLPDAECIVNPNQHGDTFESKALAGCGVMFYTVVATRQRLRELGVLNLPPLDDLLSLVAIGTVADVVKFDNNNLLLVKEGLKRIKEGKTTVGINTLIKELKKDPQKLTTADIGFGIAPNINAAGRLISMEVGIELMTTEKEKLAQSYSCDLVNINIARKEKEKQMIDIANMDISLGKEKSIILSDSRFHAGVIGIVAGRFKEQYYKPTIVFAEDGQYLKGSARSISSLHLKDTLTALDTKHPGILVKYGGHAMAAGMTIYKDRFEDFKTFFNQELDLLLSDEDLEEVIYHDGIVTTKDITKELIKEIDSIPWGQGFLPPTFRGQFKVKNSYSLSNGKHQKVTLEDEFGSVVGLKFNTENNFLSVDSIVDILFVPQLNVYNNVESIQFLIRRVL